MLLRNKEHEWLGYGMNVGGALKAEPVWGGLVEPSLWPAPVCLSVSSVQSLSRV